MRVDFVVIGRGLMGTACARYLAEAGCRVTLVGPDEPSDPARHDGPFGSFHDAGRITRTIAHDPVWARLSSRSLARYREIEARTGIDFYTECGGVMAGLDHGAMAGFTAGFHETPRALGLVHEPLDGAALSKRFPMFALPDGSRGVFDPLGGHVDPRAMRRAHEVLALEAGAEVVTHHVVDREGGTVTLADGRALSAEHVVVATGGWATAAPLGMARPAMRVFQRTVVLAEISETEAERLKDTPSLIWVPENDPTDRYLLPAIRYPDGRIYVKIGGEWTSPEAHGGDGLNAWFKTNGGAEAGQSLLADLVRVMPDMRIERVLTLPCAVTFTKTGYPYVARIDDRATLLTGGNGAAAKCADELGRLGAVAALGGNVAAEGLGTDFAPVFA
ncbi:MAG: NAD(P)/FAD-dependent oxidoreductase [Roseicyclus sp.]|uniref:NAD(P)/FAD-dependent oxidoreductase n=1 Tax=Roseicyclus sp. TaxID=1914329 RepID=UPI003A84FDC8